MNFELRDKLRREGFQTFGEDREIEAMATAQIIRLLRRKGYEVRLATPEEDRRGCDFWLIRGGRSLAVDLKVMNSRWSDDLPVATWHRKSGVGVSKKDRRGWTFREGSLTTHYLFVWHHNGRVMPDLLFVEKARYLQDILLLDRLEAGKKVVRSEGKGECVYIDRRVWQMLKDGEDHEVNPEVLYEEIRWFAKARRLEVKETELVKREGRILCEELRDWTQKFVDVYLRS